VARAEARAARAAAAGAQASVDALEGDLAASRAALARVTLNPQPSTFNP